MTRAQQEAHARMLATLQVRTHLKMNVVPVPLPLRSKMNSRKGKKGREAAGLIIPEFRTVKQWKK